MTIAKFTLSDMEWDEVSFVDMGDDPEAKICMFKRAGGVSQDESDVFGGEQVEDTYSEDLDTYARTESGKVFQLNKYAFAKNEDGETEMVVEEATLLFDPDLELEEGDFDDAGDNDGGLLKSMGRFFDSIAAMVQPDHSRAGNVSPSEGVSDGGDVAAQLRKANEEGGSEEMAGISREGKTPGEIAYLDALEAGQGVEAAQQAQQQADQLASASGGQQEGAADAPSAAAQQEGAGEALQGGTISPGDVEGDTGQHRPPDLEKMMKAANMPEPMRQIFRAQQQTIESMSKREEEQVYVNKARGFQVLPISPAEFGPVLHRIAKGRTTEADEKFVLDTMRSCEELAKQGNVMFRATGAGRGRTEAGSAEKQLIQKAQAMVAESKTKGENLSLELALGKVRQAPENTELVKAYNEGRDV